MMDGKYFRACEHKTLVKIHFKHFPPPSFFPVSDLKGKKIGQMFLEKTCQIFKI